jgi:lipopolysaccharide transport system ATP-binding protein
MMEPQIEHAISCVGVEKSYSIEREARLWKILFGDPDSTRAIHALRGITMQVPTGKIVGVIGKNGAGKSTLLRVLAGVYEPSAGQITVIGDVAGLFELGGFGNLNLTGRDYARRYLGIMGAKNVDIDTLLIDVHAFSELEEAFDHAVLTYSSGMRARLYFATATALQSDVYLVDELLSVGDEHFQSKCWLRMRDRLLNGASGVLITHDWSAALKLCEHTCVIDKGAFKYSGPTDLAVVNYLNIPAPVAGTVRFAPSNAQTHVATSGQDAHLRFVVDIQDSDTHVELAISIEKLRIGIGWEIILLNDNIPVASEPGRYELVVTIPNLPLTPGEYSLNAFLSGFKGTQRGIRTQFDMRTWTVGNGWHLHVDGVPAQSVVRLPYVVRKLAEVA